MGTLKVFVWNGYWPNIAYQRGLDRSSGIAGGRRVNRHIQVTVVQQSRKTPGQEQTVPLLPLNRLSLEQNLAKQAGGSRMKWVDR